MNTVYSLGEVIISRVTNFSNAVINSPVSSALKLGLFAAFCYEIKQFVSSIELIDSSVSSTSMNTNTTPTISQDLVSKRRSINEAASKLLENIKRVETNADDVSIEGPELESLSSEDKKPIDDTFVFSTAKKASAAFELVITGLRESKDEQVLSIIGNKAKEISTLQEWLRKCPVIDGRVNVDEEVLSIIRNKAKESSTLQEWLRKCPVINGRVNVDEQVLSIIRNKAKESSILQRCLTDGSVNFNATGYKIDEPFTEETNTLFAEIAEALEKSKRDSLAEDGDQSSLTPMQIAEKKFKEKNSMLKIEKLLLDIHKAQVLFSCYQAASSYKKELAKITAIQNNEKSEDDSDHGSEEFLSANQHIETANEILTKVDSGNKILITAISEAQEASKEKEQAPPATIEEAIQTLERFLKENTRQENVGKKEKLKQIKPKDAKAEKKDKEQQQKVEKETQLLAQKMEIFLKLDTVIDLCK